FHVTGVQTCALPIWVPESADGETREFDLPAGFLGVTAVLGGVRVLGLRLGERLGLEFLAAALVAAALLSGRRRARIRRSGGPAARGEYQHQYAGAHGRVCGSDHAGLLALATPLFDLPQCPPRDRRRQWSAYTASNRGGVPHACGGAASAVREQLRGLPGDLPLLVGRHDERGHPAVGGADPGLSLGGRVGLRVELDAQERGTLEHRSSQLGGVLTDAGG